jgi:hypothetical protein
MHGTSRGTARERPGWGGRWCGLNDRTLTCDVVLYVRGHKTTNKPRPNVTLTELMGGHIDVIHCSVRMRQRVRVSESVSQ